MNSGDTGSSVGSDAVKEMFDDDDDTKFTI